MAKTGFHPYRKGYREVLNGSEMYAHCDSIGAAMAGRLGSGYTHDTVRGKVRIHTRVKTTAGGFFKEAQTHAMRHTFGA